VIHEFLGLHRENKKAKVRVMIFSLLVEFSRMCKFSRNLGFARKEIILEIGHYCLVL
jgi:hypothetical protein